MPLSVIDLAFDPVMRLSETTSIRWETVGLAIVLFAGLLLAARFGSRPAATGSGGGPEMRRDDFVFMVVGAVPGAIVGGRLGYVLDHLDYYKANAAAILDPAQGGYTLTLAVPLGLLTGALIARILGAPVGRWMHAVASPLLFVLAAGKLVGVLGATGQGLPSDLGWATAYGGPGPWASLAAGMPSHPSQVYEAILLAVAVILLYVVARRRRFREPDGAVLLAALGLWATARFFVAFTWRDALVAGPLRMEQLLLVGVAIIAAIGIGRLSRAAAPVLDAPGVLEPGAPDAASAEAENAAEAGSGAA